MYDDIRIGPQVDNSGGDQPPQRGKTLQEAIRHIESSNRYGLSTPITSGSHKGEHALGAYQVLESNLPQWSREVYGRPLSPQEFLGSPEAQDAIAGAKLQQYENRYGPAGAASMWFTGSPNAPNIKDQFGTTGPGYVHKAMALMTPGLPGVTVGSGPQVASARPMGAQAAPIGGAPAPQQFSAVPQGGGGASWAQIAQAYGIDPKLSPMQLQLPQAPQLRQIAPQAPQLPPFGQFLKG